MIDSGIKKVGVAQWDVKLGNIDYNMEKASFFLEKSIQEQVSVAVFPEMWSSGFDYPNLEAHAEKTREILDFLTKITASSGMVVCGSLPEKKDTGVYNTLFVVDSGKVTSSYSKIHLFTPTGEDRRFAAGKRAVVCRTSAGILGLVICYDLRFPELSRSLTLAGAEMIICSAQWPESRIAHWNTLLAARAIENQVFVIASNRCGHDFNMDYGGSSRIMSPYGRIIAECGNDEAFVTAEVDPGEMENFRSMMPCLDHIKPEAYKAYS